MGMRCRECVGVVCGGRRDGGLLSGWRVMDLLFDGVEVVPRGGEERIEDANIVPQ